MGLRTWLKRQIRELKRDMKDAWDEGYAAGLGENKVERKQREENKKKALDSFVIERYRASLQTLPDVSGVVFEPASAPAAVESETTSVFDPETLSCETYELSVDAEIDYIDKAGDFTRRQITTETIYLYEDGVIVIRAFCHLRKDFRTFVSKRIKYWVDTRTSLPVLPEDLVTYLVRCSDDDYSNIASRLLSEIMGEIEICCVMLGTFMPESCKVRVTRYKNKYFTPKGKYVRLIVDYLMGRDYDWLLPRRGVHDDEQDRMLDTPGPRVAGLPISQILESFSDEEKEELAANLRQRLFDAEGSPLNIKMTKSLYRHKPIEIKKKFVAFVGTLFEGSPARDSVIRILSDELLDPSYVINWKEDLNQQKEQEVQVLREQAEKSKQSQKTSKRLVSKKKRNASFKRSEEKDLVLNLAVTECETRILQKLEADEKVFPRQDFEREIRQAIMDVLTKEEIAERGDMFLVRLGAGISLGYVRSGLKEKNGGWYKNDEGVVVIDLNNLEKD